MRRVLLPALALVLILGTGVVHGMRTVGGRRTRPLPTRPTGWGRCLTASAIGRAKTCRWRGASRPAWPPTSAGASRTRARAMPSPFSWFAAGPVPWPFTRPTSATAPAATPSARPLPNTLPPASDEQGPAEFWTVDMARTTSAERSRLRIFWAWHGGHDGWQAADKPRVLFASEPVLFKIYLLRDLTGVGDPRSIATRPSNSCRPCFRLRTPSLFP